MRIWFDILTPKQVLFFKPSIDIIKELGFDLLCSSREYREAVELARIKDLDLKLVGKHGGSNKYDKLKASIDRSYQLCDLIKSFEPDLSISFSSPEASRISFGLGIKHIAFNDSPHAEAVAKLTIPLIKNLLCPWIIPKTAWHKFGINNKNIFQYRALDPVAWIKRDYNLDKVKKNHTSRSILIRLEENKASYIADKNLANSSIRMLDEVIKSFSLNSEITVLCRYEDQIDYIRNRYGKKVNLISNVVDGSEVISNCDIFIGAGGTMTAEASLVGKPTISIAPISFHVERYLIKSGLIFKTFSSKQLIKYIRRVFSDSTIYDEQLKLSKTVLDSMEDPVSFLISYIKNNA